MKQIVFDNVVPEVFAQKGELHSEIWRTHISFDKGKTYLVEADSGMGKSTFCSYIVGYRNDYSGTIRFDEQDIRVFRITEWTNIRCQHISHLFQELRLFSELTAYENVEIKNKLTNFKTREEILCWFDRLGLTDKVDTKIGRMSFGQQQRVALIRALVQPFDFLFADEPISHLDDMNANLMGRIMMEEAQTQGAGVIITSIGKHIALNYDKTLKL